MGACLIAVLAVASVVSYARLFVLLRRALVAFATYALVVAFRRPSRGARSDCSNSLPTPYSSAIAR